jgi:hypothetical protein
MLGKRARFETRALYGHRGVLSGDIPARQALPRVIEEDRGYTASGENPSSKVQTEGKSTLKGKKRNNVPEEQVQQA